MATLLLNHGIPVIVVSRRLGYARVSIILDIYGYIIPSMQSKTAELMDDLVTLIELHQNCTKILISFPQPQSITPICTAKKPSRGVSGVGAIELEYHPPVGPTTFSV